MNTSRGCLSSLISEVAATVIIIVMIVAIALTSFITLFFANSFGETCGYIHPHVFQISVNVIDDSTGTVSTSSATQIPVRPITLAQNAGQGGDAPPLDTILRVYEELVIDGATERVLIAENDDFNQVGGGSAVLDFQTPSVSDQTLTPGDILIEVATFNDSGSFILDIRLSASADDPRPELETISRSRILRFDDATYILRESPIRDGRFVRYRLPRSELVAPIDISVSGVSSDNVGDAIETTLVMAFGSVQVYAGTDIADGWASCIEHYGYFSDGAFVINANAFRQFAPPALAFRNKMIDRCVDPNVDTTILSNDALLREIQQQCQLSADVTLSTNGRLIFYFLLPMTVIVGPLVIAGVIARRRGWLWFVFMVFVALQANAVALMLVHLSQVSQVEALGEFGYAIFGGIITGAALAFIEQLMNRIAQPGDNTAG